MPFSDSGFLNIGWTIDLERGIFSVPRDGSYALFFNALSGYEEQKETALSIMCNEEQLITARAEGEQPFTLSTVQWLKSGDKLSLLFHYGSIWVWLGKKHKDRKYKTELEPISVFSAFSIE